MHLGKRFILPVAICTALAVASPALAGGPPPLPTPLISCAGSTASSITLQVCGGAVLGAPAGFSIHMKKLSDFNVDGWAATGSYTCLSLGGNCPASPWSLAAGQCVNVVISASTVADYAAAGVCGVSSDCGIPPLDCGTTYVFRVFAHNVPGGGFGASDKGPDPPLQCSTAPCNPGDCTFTWGYWKTHGPEGCSPGNQTNDWDVSSLKIGSLTMGVDQLCSILNSNPAACGKGTGANAVLLLEHQLIAAMLNVANGGISCGFANQAIIDANNLLSGHELDCVGTASVLGQQLLAQQSLLAAYNNDVCSCPVPQSLQGPMPTGTTEVQKSTWGKLKSIYR
jgi:hypothetical protein